MASSSSNSDQLGSIRFGDHVISQYKPNKNEFLNRMTVLFGGSGTGKTVTAKYILMNALKNHLTAAFLFSATEIQNGDFKGMIPNACIYHDLDYDTLCAIVDRQKAMVEMYKRSQDVDVLKHLYAKYPDSQINEHIKKQLHLYEKLKRKYNDIEDENEKLRRLEQLDLQCEERMREIYKVGIRFNLERYRKSDKLDDVQKLTIEWIDVPPPRVAIIIEDFGEMLRQFSPAKFPVFASLFTKARHYYITTIINVQDDTFLNKNLRNNVHNTIFTNGTCAAAYFSRPGMPHHLKKFINAHHQTFFNDHRTLIYFKEKDDIEDAIKYMCPTLVRKTFIGLAEFVKLALQAEKRQKSDVDDSNQYIKKAISYIK